MDWVEDPSNSTPVYIRNVARMAIQKYSPVLQTGLMDLIGTFRDAREKSNKESNPDESQVDFFVKVLFTFLFQHTLHTSFFRFEKDGNS